MSAARMLVVVGALACALVVAAMQAASSPARALARPHACSLLQDGLEEWPSIRDNTGPDPGSTAISCSRSGDPPTQSCWLASFHFVPYPAAALRKAWAALAKKLRSGKNPAEHLVGFGADDAFAAHGWSRCLRGRVETHAIAWRKGLYIGGLELIARSNSPEYDEPDYAATVLRAALRRLPRR